MYFNILVGLLLSFEFLQSFLKRGITLASFRNHGKSTLLIEALIEGWIKSVNMSAFSLIILVVKILSWQALETSDNFLKNFLFSTFEKLNKSFDFETLSIAFILGWSLYFKIAFKTISERKLLTLIYAPYKLWSSDNMKQI